MSDDQDRQVTVDRDELERLRAIEAAARGVVDQPASVGARVRLLAALGVATVRTE